MSKVCDWYEHSKSGFYKHREVEERRSIIEENALFYIRELRKSGIMCGIRKMKIYLMKLFNFKIGRDFLNKIMKKHNLLCSYYKKRVATSTGKKTDYPNLLKGKKIKEFGKALVTDITYIHLPNGGFCYASVISDVKSRMILGYYVSDNLMVDGSMKALKMALKNYDISKGAIHHSDHGVQYTSLEYTGYLIKKGIKISMTGDGKCYDNAQAERIFNTLKHEYGFKNTFPSIKAVRAEMTLFVESYNNVRIHESLEYLTPREMYESLTQAA